MTEASTERLRSALGGGDGLVINGLWQKDQSARLDLSIGTSLQYFRGHFESQPVLPGVVQVHWAMQAGKILFPSLGAFRQLVRLKCRNMISPNTLVALELTNQHARQTLEFRYCNADTVFTTGAFLFSRRLSG